jgi:MFS transporter, UMF1 family
MATKIEKSWILYDVASSAYTLIVVTAVMPVFFSSFAGSNLSKTDAAFWWGAVNSCSSVLVALVAPIIGAFADLPGNKTRFLKSFVICGALTTLLFPTIQAGQWQYALILYLLATSAYSCANVCYDSLLIDVTEHERMDRISSLGYAWGYIGSVIPFVAIMLGLMILPEYFSWTKTNVTKGGFILTGVWWLAFSIPAFLYVKQKFNIRPEGKIVRTAFRSLGKTIREISKNRPLLLFILAYFLYIDGCDTMIRMATLFGDSVGLSMKDMMIVLLVIQIFAFPGAMMYGYLADKYSARKMVLVAIGVYCLIVLIGFIMPRFQSQDTRLALFWVIALLTASSQGGIQALSRSMFGCMIPKERAAEYFGFYNIFGRFAAIIGPILLGVSIKLTGSWSNGILILLSLFIGGAFLLVLSGRQSKPQKG